MINFRSELHCALLGYYFANEDAKHYVRELSRLLSIDVAPLSRELKKFARLGIFSVSTRGQEKYFSINKNYPVYNELKRMTAHLVAKKQQIKIKQ